MAIRTTIMLKRFIIAGLIGLVLLTILNFAGFFSPGFNPDGYRGTVQSVTWRQGDGNLRTASVSAGDLSQVELPLAGSDRLADGYHLKTVGYDRIRVAVDSRWTSVTLRESGRRESYLIRNEAILEIRTR